MNMSRPTVLIIDNEPAVLTSMSNVLSSDYRVRAANSGTRALQMLANPPLPDLILLDVQMPVMDGYAVLEQLKNDAFTCDIPVIFVTATDSAAGEEKGLALGAVDFVTKPINPPLSDQPSQADL